MAKKRRRKNKEQRTQEVYVDDMLVKSKQAESHVNDLAETFQILRNYRMKLNPLKCAFGVASGKFLGFMVNERGIEANSEKILALMNMRSPRTVKEVQSLTGQVAALSRFISKATDKCIPFFDLLKRVKDFEWTEQCEQAFQQLKEYMGRAPLLSKPVEGEKLILYLRVSDSALSAALGLRIWLAGLPRQQDDFWLKQGGALLLSLMHSSQEDVRERATTGTCNFCCH